MKIRIRATGQVVTESEFRAMHKNVSFPTVLTLDILSEFGADPVLEAPAPSVTETQVAYRDGVTQDARGNWVYAWAVRELTSEEIEARKPTREQLKQTRADAVARIQVTTSTGKTFDGDEDSQTRMARAILIGQATGKTSALWTLADNSDQVVTLAEITEALALAGQRQAELWPLP